MKELNLEFEQKQIKVNGHVFDVRKTDADVMETANSLMEKYEEIKNAAGMGRTERCNALVEVVNETIAFTDEMLGEGAVKKITGGRPVGMAMGVRMMRDIALCVAEIYSEDMDREFGIDTDSSAKGA